MISFLDWPKNNVKKTKVMFKSLKIEQRFEIGSEAPEVVRGCIYLGQAVTSDPIHETEMTRRRII